MPGMKDENSVVTKAEELLDSVSTDRKGLTRPDPAADDAAYKEEVERMDREAALQKDDVTKEAAIKENKSLSAEAEAKASAAILENMDADEDEEEAEDNEDSMTYGFSRMKRRERNQRYFSDRGILSIGDTLEADTPQKRMKAALVELEASRRGGTILTGRIIGAEEFVNSLPCAKLLMSGWSVLIPVTELIPKEMMPEKLSGSAQDQMFQLRSLIEAREGSVIDFVVRGINEKECIAVASRLDAMALMRASYFWRQSRNTGKYIISEGQVVEGRVQYSNRNGIAVEAFGKESFIRASECAWKRINPAEVFAPGDKILVKMVKIDREVGKDVRTLTTRMSVKEAYPNQNELYFDQFKVGQRYAAKVTWVDENGIYCQVGDFEAGEAVQARCLFPKGDRKPPREGDVIQVIIRSKHPENHFVTCDITGRFFSNGKPSKVW